MKRPWLMRTYSRWLTLSVAVVGLTLVFSPVNAQTTLIFAQCAVGGGATTVFTVHNPGATSLDVSVDLIPSNGGTPFHAPVTLAASETRTLTYGGAAGTLAVGWARLSAASEFEATCFFRIAALGNVGVLPGEPTLELKLFAFFAPGTRTALAMANPSDTLSSSVTARIFNMAGVYQGQATFPLPPRNHGAVYLDEAPFNMSTDGYLEVTATQPVVALTLRQDNNLLSAAPVITAAATAITGYERVVTTENFTGLLGAHSAQATCPSGKKALGGSAYIDWLFAGDRPLVRLEDYPSNDTTWHATLSNHNDHAVNGAFKVVVICAKCQ